MKNLVGFANSQWPIWPNDRGEWWVRFESWKVCNKSLWVEYRVVDGSSYHILGDVTPLIPPSGFAIDPAPPDPFVLEPMNP